MYLLWKYVTQGEELIRETHDNYTYKWTLMKRIIAITSFPSLFVFISVFVFGGKEKFHSNWYKWFEGGTDILQHSLFAQTKLFEHFFKITFLLSFPWKRCIFRLFCIIVSINWNSQNFKNWSFVKQVLHLNFLRLWERSQLASLADNQFNFGHKCLLFFSSFELC